MDQIVGIFIRSDFIGFQNSVVGKLNIFKLLPGKVADRLIAGFLQISIEKIPDRECDQDADKSLEFHGIFPCCGMVIRVSSLS